MRCEASHQGCGPLRGRRQTALLALLVLHGCTSMAPPSAPPPAVPKAGAPPVPRPAALAVERQWLQSWFKDTPVRIEQRSEAAFTVEVPREFCFEPGRSEVRPALGAVLDKLAQSLLRKPELHVELLAAPGDGAGMSPLARQRADNVRKHLMARGVSAQRLAEPTLATQAAVQLRIGLPAS